MTHISLAFSPDSDDAFMFWALLNGKIDANGLTFTHSRAHTEKLNLAAQHDTNAPDVTAVSIHQYAYLTDNYFLLPHGGSVGTSYGPIVVSKRPLGVEQLKGARIAIPGRRTTAYLVLRIIVGDFDAIEIPIEPYSRVFDAVKCGEVDAAILIHEGRLRYEEYGLAPVLELGEVWRAKTGLPLPLGGNVIRKALGKTLISMVSNVLKDSIRWALDHRDYLIDQLIKNDIRADVKLNAAMLDRYLAMYANHETLEYSDAAKQGMRVLLDQGYELGIIPQRVTIEFTP